MGGRAVFINMGFDPTASMDIVSTMSLSSGDSLVVVYPASGDEVSRLRGEQARSRIKEHLSMLRSVGRDVGYEELELDLRNMGDAIGRLLDYVKKRKEMGYEVYFEVTGGVRAITVAMVMVALWFPRYVDEVTFIVEVTRERLRIPTVSPLDVYNRPVRDVLRILASHSDVRRKDLCNELGISESSVSRAISVLKRLRIVDEKLRVVSLSERFRIFAPVFRHLGYDDSDR